MAKILVATDKPFAAIAVKGIREVVEGAGDELILLEKYGEKAKLLEAVKDVDAIIIRSDVIDAEVLDAAKQLKIVVRAGAGYDNVDLAAATAHNVCVMNTPGQNSNAVHTFPAGQDCIQICRIVNNKIQCFQASVTCRIHKVHHPDILLLNVRYDIRLCKFGRWLLKELNQKVGIHV